MDKRVLTIQDISCVGQCSLTVALPVISACGLETAVLPSSVLSTHTGGFTGYTFRDLTGDMDAILAHWEKENITYIDLFPLFKEPDSNSMKKELSTDGLHINEAGYAIWTKKLKKHI